MQAVVFPSKMLHLSCRSELTLEGISLFLGLHSCSSRLLELIKISIVKCVSKLTSTGVLAPLHCNEIAAFCITPKLNYFFFDCVFVCCGRTPSSRRVQPFHLTVPSPLRILPNACVLRKGLRFNLNPYTLINMMPRAAVGLQLHFKVKNTTQE